jgi:hypothetical protein
MIKGHYGTKLTPKQKAQEIIRQNLENIFYWDKGSIDYEAMTEREKALVNDQLLKFFDRLQAKGFNFKKGGQA